MLKKNLLREKLNSNRPVIGTWNTLASPLVTEVMAQAGFDFQIIDLEHGPFILNEIHHHVSACESGTDCSPLVRIPTNQSWMALQSLDQGAHGIVVPHIEDITAAQTIAHSIKYHPHGSRGFTPFSKAGGFSNNRTADYVRTANQETLGIVIIECLNGLKNVQEIVSVDGIDIIYFGAYDLSQALGHPGEPRHPEVVAAIRQGVAQVQSEGKYAGGFVPQSMDDIKWLLDMGIRFITYEVDSSIIFRHIKDLMDWFELEISK
uniref:HpcH/HpaI aldolase family protein n=1 Tax=Rheinheimera sp. TaxID=1869214 RepID=UPI00404844F8